MVAGGKTRRAQFYEARADHVDAQLSKHQCHMILIASRQNIVTFHASRRVAELEANRFDLIVLFKVSAHARNGFRCSVWGVGGWCLKSFGLPR